MLKKPILFRLVNENVLNHCLDQIKQSFHQAMQDHKSHVLITIAFYDAEKAKTLAQHHLYWLWVSQIAKTEGNTKERQHKILKRQHLSKIYLRDDVEFVETCLALKNAKAVMDSYHYENLAMGVAGLMSIRSATAKQMSEYLHDIEITYRSRGMDLKIPPNIQWAI